MSCASFEHDLTRVMGEELAADERATLIDGLRTHGLACEACRGTLDLVAVLETPRDARDRAADPGDAYWTEFDRRLRQRIAAAAPETRSGRRRGGWWIVAAASVAVLALTVWLATRPPRPPALPVDVVQGEAPPLPPSLESTVESASSEEVNAELAALSGWGEGLGLEPDSDTAAPAWEQGLWPEVDGLDERARRELLDWLKEQNARSGGA